MMEATSRQVEYNRRYRRRLREARAGYLRLLRRVERVERERDRLREIAAERLRLLESAIRRDRAELGRLVEGETAAALIESDVPLAEGAEVPS